MDDHAYAFRLGYYTAAALAGAITALAFLPWKGMSRSEIVLTLAVGFFFAIFVTPWVAESLFGLDESNIRAIAAMTYIFGSGSNILLPMAIRWAGRAFGSEEPKND